MQEAVKRVRAQGVGVVFFQFRGLALLTQMNIREARNARSEEGRHAATLNALLSSYAALEALIMETAHEKRRELYNDEEWREKGLIKKFATYLKDSRGARAKVPRAVGFISDLRIAVTHSLPHDIRAARLTDGIVSGKILARAGEIRNVADFLWNGDVPSFASEYIKE